VARGVRVPQTCECDCQPGPPARAAALDRALGHTEQPGGIGDRQALDVDEHDRGALVVGEGGERPVDLYPQLEAVEVVARVGDPPMAGLAVLLGERHGRARLAPAHPVEAGIDHDPVQPGRDGGLTPERRGVAERRDERVLERVRSVLGITGGAQGHRPHPVAVATYELPERVLVPGHVGCEQGLVVAHRIPGVDPGVAGRLIGCVGAVRGGVGHLACGRAVVGSRVRVSGEVLPVRRVSACCILAHGVGQPTGRHPDGW